MRLIGDSRLASVALLIGLVGLVAVGALKWGGKAAAPSSATEPAADETIPVELARVTAGPLTETIKAVGTLQANESVMLRPEIAGRVKRILFAEGQAVEQGAVLIELDDVELRAQVAREAAQLEIARLMFERMKRLRKPGNAYATEENLDRAASDLRVAEANHALALSRLDKTKLAAPFAGHLGIRRVSPGDFVQPGQEIVNLEDLRTLKIEFKVPETLLRRLAVGQRVTLATDAYPGEEFFGEIYAVNPKIDASNRAIHVLARVANVGSKLRPGLFATVSVEVLRLERALFVPEEAVLPSRDGPYVYTVSEEGTSQRAAVTLGLRQRGLVQVVEGLSEGQAVVRAGQQKLKHGTHVVTGPGDPRPAPGTAVP